jgi:hypothetical protein
VTADLQWGADRRRGGPVVDEHDDLTLYDTSSLGPAVTIRAYSHPLVRTGTYRTALGGELEREVLSLEDELRAEPALS